MPRSSKWRIYRYVDSNQVEPFTEWLRSLDNTAQRRIRVILARMEAGILSSVKWIDGNLGEYRMDTGPGYRIYIARYGRDGLVLLTGGDKSSQARDIERAKAFARALKGNS
jgi:putative addiction module killer protein